ncbi:MULTISPECIES: autotransporter outer membrane beta-barrel domain-containing protein [Psychrilyobacter]|nr:MULTISPECIES: autotransporter outer membrane beta-barrel domain-containing protein [Psychrilyobacter]NDI77292.1 autotransporter outer membrane beta-barrel domain-containing protein [Psychrilyobacter piezotolerans]
MALIAISNLANAQLNENQNEFIKVNQNNLLNGQEEFQENKILVFGNFNSYNKNSRHSMTAEKESDRAAKDNYRMSYYPALAKQTFEIMSDSNQVIFNNVIDNVKYREVNEIIAIAGVNGTRLESDSGSTSGYDTDLHSVYLGVEKQLSNNNRVGGIITIGKNDTEFTDIEDGSREDYYYQGNLYYIYENYERLKFVSMFFGGVTDTSLERTQIFDDLNETMADDINNYYLGVNNELSKKYYYDQNYIKPKFEINFAYMMQNDISESGGQGLEIDGVNSISIETGIGLALGRDFYLENRSKINLEGSVAGYVELGDPYKDLNSTINALKTDKVKIDGYNNDSFYGDISVGGSYETDDLLTIYTKVEYRIGDNLEEFVGNIGLNYLF